MRRLVFIFAILLFALSARGAADGQVWMMTTGDFQSRAVRLLAMDSKGARVAPADGGDEQFVAMDQLLDVSRDGGEVAPGNGAFVLEIAGGDRLVGRASAMSSQSIIWEHPLLGQIPVPLTQARGLSRAAIHDAPLNSDEPATQDVVWLANGDSVRGIISDLQAGTLSIQIAEVDQSVPIEMDSVSRIVFAAVGDGENMNPDGSPMFRLRLSDGSSITTRLAEVAGEKARLALNDDDQSIREIPLTHVLAVEQLNGPVIWVSSLRPNQSVQQPFFGGSLSWPARMDRSVSGRPIRFGSRTFAHGIGVHAYSCLTFDLPARDHTAFRTQYAIDGADRPYANVTIRIKLDDRVVHEQDDFGAGVLSQVVKIELGGAKTLTLEVDYGQSHDVQDRFNWIEPALVRIW